MLIPARSRYQLINVHYNHPDMEIQLRLSKHLTSPADTAELTPALGHPPSLPILSALRKRHGRRRPIQRPAGQASSLPFDQPTAVNGAVLPSPCIPLCKYRTGETGDL